MILNPFVENCRVCKSTSLYSVHSFGVVPLADKLMTHSADHIATFPLTLIACLDCYHLQIRENVAPEILFKDNYPYYSGAIPELTIHFEEYFKQVIQRIGLKDKALVIEIACNDGLLLNHFARAGYEVMGIEPSLGPAQIAVNKGIHVVKDFFDFNLAQSLYKAEKRKVDLIIANNVLAHVPDPFSFAMGVAELLADDGYAVIEVPLATQMLANGTYDVIFHQHYSYYTMHSLKYLFESVKLFITDIELVGTQGGSLRLFLSKQQVENAKMIELLNEELNINVGTLNSFSNNITDNRRQITELLATLKKQGKKIVAYGAPGKAATYLNYNKIGLDTVDYIVDISAEKQGKKFPLAGFEIHSPDILKYAAPDYVLIVSWNYASSILQQLDYLRKDFGTSFIIPFPNPHII